MRGRFRSAEHCRKVSSAIVLSERLRIAERPPHPRSARPLPARGERWRQAASFRRRIRALLLPACGEKVRMRGHFRSAEHCRNVSSAVVLSERLRIAERPPHPRFARPLPARGERWRQAASFRRRIRALLLSACGEKVGMRGRWRCLSIAGMSLMQLLRSWHSKSQERLPHLIAT
jgi:hypothetical protein